MSEGGDDPESRIPIIDILFSHDRPDSDEDFEKRLSWLENTREQIIGGREPPPQAGTETGDILYEAKRAYVSGLFIATIFLTASIVEDLLQGELAARGRIEVDDHERMPTLIDLSENENMINGEEASKITKLHDDRRTYFHFRDYSQMDSPTIRWLDQATEDGPSFIDPQGNYHKQEERARHGLKTMFELIGRPWNEWDPQS